MRIVLAGRHHRRAIEMHRGPGPGGYGELHRVTGSSTVTPQAFPDITLPLGDIFLYGKASALGCADVRVA